MYTQQYTFQSKSHWLPLIHTPMYKYKYISTNTHTDTHQLCRPILFHHSITARQLRKEQNKKQIKEMRFVQHGR